MAEKRRWQYGPILPAWQLIRTQDSLHLACLRIQPYNNPVIDPVDFSVLTQYDLRIQLINELTNFVLSFDSGHKKNEFVRSNQPVNTVLKSTTLFACRKPRALPSTGNSTLLYNQVIIISCYLPVFLESDRRRITLSVSNVFLKRSCLACVVNIGRGSCKRRSLVYLLFSDFKSSFSAKDF